MADSGSPMLTPAFAPIAGGRFTMGTQLGHEDERPPHAVFVDGFELGVCPVTRAEYECFVDATGHEPPCDWSHPLFAQADLPVVGVSWIDAVAYCAWRSEQDGRPVRLPTEAEWEFAARGRQEALFPWGDVMP
jgi:sulfatase modifying factor 1